MSRLRSFKLLGHASAAAAPLIRQGLSGTGAIIGANLVNLDGYSSIANVWLQLFDSATLPANGTVPLKSIYVAAIGPLPSLFYNIGPVTFLNGLWVALSTTEGTLTASASSFDVWGEVEEWDALNGLGGLGSLNVSTATTAADTKLQVWADAAGPKKLYGIWWTADVGADIWVLVFAKDAPVNGDIDFVAAVKWLDGQNKTMYFGDDGLSPYVKESDGTVHDGCTLVLSTTGNKLTTSLVATAGGISAYYK